MLKFAIFFLSTAFAKLDKPSYEYILVEYDNEVQEHPPLLLRRNLPSDAWVLSLDTDVETLRLREASYEEAKGVFGNSMNDGPSYRQPGEASSSKRARKQKKIKLDEKAMLAAIMRVINKFALTTQSEPNVYLGDDGDKTTPTLKLYFRGVDTSLVVRAENREWHYIIRPALFPEWFYQQHLVQRDAAGKFVEVPRDVASEFYAALFHVLTMFLSVPV